MNFEEIENGYYFAECDSFDSELAKEIWLIIESKGFIIQSKDSFDYLRIEIWLDSGSFIIFPSDWPYQKRTDKFGIKLFVRNWLRFWEKTDELSKSDDEFDRKINDYLVELSENIKVLFEPYFKQNELKAVIYEFGETKLKSF